MSRIDRTLQLRAQEIISKSEDPISIQAAVEQALRERTKGDYDMVVKIASAIGASSMNGLRKRTYDLPEMREDTLFDIPALIVIGTPDGDLFVPRDHASTAHTRQWIREGRQHHGAQSMRFERADEDMAAIEDVADDVPWSEARELLKIRKKALDPGSE